MDHVSVSFSCIGCAVPVAVVEPEYHCRPETTECMDFSWHVPGLLSFILLFHGLS